LAHERSERGFQRGASGPDAAALKPPTGGKGTCSWLDGPAPHFATRASDHGVCDRPIWLRATGFSHWAYALKKRLPPGKYVIYSRATGANGLSESNFTAADKNRVQFTVK